MLYASSLLPTPDPRLPTPDHREPQSSSSLPLSTISSLPAGGGGVTMAVLSGFLAAGLRSSAAWDLLVPLARCDAWRISAAAALACSGDAPPALATSPYVGPAGRVL